MHNLVHPLVRYLKVPRQVCLRDARSVSGPDDAITFVRGETEVRRRGVGVESFENTKHGGMDHTQDTNVLGPNSPYGASDSSRESALESSFFSPSDTRLTDALPVKTPLGPPRQSFA